MKSGRALVLCALGLSVVLAAGCNKNTNNLTVAGPSPTGPATISITPRTVEVRLTTNPTTGRCEATQQFTVVPEGNLPQFDVFRWTVSGADTTISASGFARAGRVGSYAVGADIAGLHASATFNVVPGDCVGEQGPVAGPGAFTLSRVSCEVASLGRLAKISWTPSSGADKYRVMMHEWSTGVPRSLGETVGHSYEQVADLKAATYFQVVAIGANGMETQSSPADLLVCEEVREEPPIVPPPPPPPPPPSCPANPDFEITGGGRTDPIMMVKGQLLNLNVVNWPTNACNPFWFTNDPSVVQIAGADTVRNIGGANYYAGVNAAARAIYNGSTTICVQGDIANNYHPGCHPVRVVDNLMTPAFTIDGVPNVTKVFRRLRFMDVPGIHQTYTPKK